MAVSADESRIVTGDESGGLRVYSEAGALLVSHEDAHSGEIWAIEFHPTVFIL